MWRIVVRVAFAILAAGSLTLAVLTALYQQRWPAWAWCALAGIACIGLLLTCVRLKPSRWPSFVSLKLKIWSLQTLKWLINKRAFQYIVFRPFAFGVLVWIVWRLFTDPDKLNASGNPQVAAMVAQIKAMMDKRTEYPKNGPERDRGIALNQSMTWGVAGAAIILLTTEIVATHPAADKAALIAAACFAFAIPTLVISGFIQLTHASAAPSDQGIQSPTLRQAMKVIGRTHMAYFFVCVGVAAMLWSYDWKVSVVFMMALYWALRLYRRTVVVGSTKQPAAGSVELPSQNEVTPEKDKAA